MSSAAPRSSPLAARRPLDDVDRAARHVDLPANSRITPLDAPGLNGRERPERGEERGECDEGERHPRAISRLRPEAVKAPDQPARP